MRQTDPRHARAGKRVGPDERTVSFSSPEALSSPRITRVSRTHRQTPQTPIKIAAAAAAVLSRLALYALAYGFYRAGGGTQSFAGSFEALWTHWDVRHYLGIAKDGYTSVGDERLRLVFFPLYPAVTRVFSVFTGGRLFMAGTLV